MFEISGFEVQDTCRVKRDATVTNSHCYKREGRPQQFLLQLVSDLTSILTVFKLFKAQNKDYGNKRK